MVLVITKSDGIAREKPSFFQYSKKGRECILSIFGDWFQESPQIPKSLDAEVPQYPQILHLQIWRTNCYDFKNSCTKKLLYFPPIVPYDI